ncbi:hypothetical protein FF38_04448, partial [Lucilia cuprina]
SYGNSVGRCSSGFRSSVFCPGSGNSGTVRPSCRSGSKPYWSKPCCTCAPQEWWCEAADKNPSLESSRGGNKIVLYFFSCYW